MTITKSENGKNIVLTLSGRLDTTTAPQLQEALIPEFYSGNKVTLDFTEIAYVSSAGLRVLLMGEKTAKARDSKQVLINVSDEIMEVFEMTGFSGVLHITG